MSINGWIEKLLYIIICLFSVFTLGGSVLRPFFFADFRIEFLLGSYLIYSLIVLLALKCSSENKKRFLLILTVIQSFLMLFAAVTVRVKPISDLGYLIRQAADMIKYNTHYLTDSEYFSVNANNIPIAIVIYWFFRAAAVLTQSEAGYSLVCGVINCIFILTAVFCLFRIIDIISVSEDGSFAAKMLIIANPLWIPYTSYYYTDTLSFPFMAGGLLCVTKGIYSHNNTHRLICFFFGNFLFFIGTKIRVTTAIMIIALFLVCMIRKEGKQLLQYTVTFLAAFLIGGVGYNVVYNYHVDFDTYDSALPPSHFLMMGSHGNGIFDYEDREYTMSFSTHEEKVRNNLIKYAEKIRENGIIGNFALVITKERLLWCDGARAYNRYIAEVYDTSLLYEFIASDNGLYIYLCQVYNVVWIILVSIAVISSKKSSKYYWLLIFYWFGTILFSMIWEAHPRHSLTYIPFISLLCCLTDYSGAGYFRIRGSDSADTREKQQIEMIK